MSTHNICLYGEREKIILELSSNTPPYQVSCVSLYIDAIDVLTAFFTNVLQVF